LPDVVKRQLGLDRARQWLCLDEVNRFVWPGYDLRSVPAHPGVFDYGMLPQALFVQLLHGILARNRAKKLSLQDRD
jgi:hypothetical protein